MRFSTRSMHHYTQLSRRSILIVSITLTLICLFYVRNSLIPLPTRDTSAPVFSTPASGCPVIPPAVPYSPAGNTRFRWRDVPLKHPIQQFKQLSESEVQPLPQIQFRFTPFAQHTLEQRHKRRQKVKRVFQRCWSSYKSHAWLKDELAPMSGQSKNPFGGWGATLVDSLDTLHIMEMFEEFDEAVAAAVGIDFGPDTSSLEEINIFETTIRYLGGFLAAYDIASCSDTRLLEKALEVGDLIYKSCDTPNHMPVTRWKPRDAAAGKEQTPPGNALIAELGSSGLELTRLSQVSGDMRFYDQAVRLADLFEEQQNKTSLPGMWPILTDAGKGDLTIGHDYSLGGMSDSAYEYLPKMYELMGGINAAPQHELMYKKAMKVAVDKMLYRPMLPDGADVLVPTGYHIDVEKHVASIDARGEHLACFVGGMLALGGRLFGLDEHIHMGRKVTDGCVWAYRNSRLGMMPEILEFSPCESRDFCTWDEVRYRTEVNGDVPHGFVAIHDGRYILRPEAIESVFYLYRITGDESYQDIAWEMFEAIENHTHTRYANAALASVNDQQPSQMDSMESFWMGETLKYFYLIFSDPSLISLDDFVFNTEAHPFRRPK